MRSSVGERTERQSNSSITFVRQQYRKGYTIPMLPHQQFGILSKVLWPSKNQILRIIPGYNPETGEVFRQNKNCNQFSPDANYDDYLEDTFYKATIVTKFGSMNSPFIIDYEPGSPDEQAYGGETVLHNFIRTIIYASNGKGRSRIRPINEWKMWTAMGPQSTIAFDKTALLMQALVFHTNGRNNTDMETGEEMRDADGDLLPLLAVVALDNKASITNLVQALVEPMNPGQPLDAKENNKYGAMAEMEGNQLYLNTYNDTQTQHPALRPSVQAPGQGWTPTPFPLGPDAVKQLWTPWEQLLQYMTAEEQLKLCAREFGADTVNYVIGTDPRMVGLTIPDEIKNAGYGRYASLVGGGSISLSSNNFSPSSYGTKPSPATKLGKGLTAQQKAPAFNPAKGLGAVPNTSGIPKSAGIDVQAVLAKAQAIREAAAGNQAQAEAAIDVLGLEE